MNTTDSRLTMMGAYLTTIAIIVLIMGALLAFAMGVAWIIIHVPTLGVFLLACAAFLAVWMSQRGRG